MYEQENPYGGIGTTHTHTHDQLGQHMLLSVQHRSVAE